MFHAPCSAGKRALDGVACLQLMESTGNGRDINRHRYSLEEAGKALEKPVVKALLDLCRFRNMHPAFQGEVRAQRMSRLSSTFWPRPFPADAGILVAAGQHQ